MNIGFPHIIGASLILAIGGLFLMQQAYDTSNAPETVLSVQEQQGNALVTSYCSDCHAIGKTGTSRHATAPKFRQLHTFYDVTFLEEALVEGLVAHPDMPEFEFDTPQAQAIIAYIQTLAPQ